MRVLAPYYGSDALRDDGERIRAVVESPVVMGMGVVMGLSFAAMVLLPLYEMWLKRVDV